MTIKIFCNNLSSKDTNQVNKVDVKKMFHLNSLTILYCFNINARFIDWKIDSWNTRFQSTIIIIWFHSFFVDVDSYSHLNICFYHKKIGMLSDFVSSFIWFVLTSFYKSGHCFDIVLLFCKRYCLTIYCFDIVVLFCKR